MYGYSNANKQPNYHEPWMGHHHQMATTGADPAPVATMDKLKAFMNQQTMGVANKYLIGGAAVVGLGYYGYTKGWF